jgi:hypothetical protein
MNLVNDFALMLSGGIIAGSILLSEIGFRRSALSRKGGAIFSGIGVGIGCGIFIFYSIGKGDLIGSIFVGIVATITTVVTAYLTLGRLGLR